MLIIVPCVIAAAVCLRIGFIFAQRDEGQIPDENGADTSLSTIAPESFRDDTYAAWKGEYSAQGEKSGVIGLFEDKDCDNAQYSAEKFLGVCTVLATRGNGRTLRITAESELSSGNLQLALVGPNGEVLAMIDAGETQTLELQTRAGELYLLKAGGESARMTVRVQREFL